MKSFSVVLTYFKRPELLSRALYCLSQQTYTRFEVVPIFDRDEDPEATFVYQQFRTRCSNPSQYKNIVYFTEGSPCHYGNDARHHALKHCNNDYVLWYGHDCLIDKDFLQTHAEQIQDDTCVSVVSQAHFTSHDHPLAWLSLRTHLPATSDPHQLVMSGIDLLNYAIPLSVAKEYAWPIEMRHRYDADWITFREIRDRTELPVRISRKVVCAHF
jgi:glycosyltransferase involved in cell wall biosynthesis